MRVKLKNSVRGPKTLVLLAAAVNAADILGLPEVYVTSANDSGHMPGSKHYTDEALDFRTHTYTDGVVESWAAMIRERLGRDYDVVIESDHLHVEHDPKS